jgi:hypothetical protein
MRVNDGVFVRKNTKDMERAQAAFHKKEIQAREGATAAAEYKAAGMAERAKTERLRALRLAKEAADREAALRAPPPPPPKPKVPAKPVMKVVSAARPPSAKPKAAAAKPKAVAKTKKKK